MGLAVVLVLAALAQPALTAARALLLLPAFFPSTVLQPLQLVTAAPGFQEVTYTYAVGTVVADLYRPASGGPHPGILLLLGARPAPLQDPLVVQVAQGLARAGLVVLVPESSNLAAGLILPEETDAVDKGFDLLSNQPDVDAARVGMLGLSVGGALSLIAASQPALQGRVRFVNTLGAYEDASRLLVDVVSQTVVNQGQEEPWNPDPLAREVLAEQLIDVLPASDQAPLERSYVAGGAALSPDEAAGLSAEGQDVMTLLNGVGSRAEAQADVARLGAAARMRLEQISPSTYLARLTAPLYVMDDRDDTLIPSSESAALVAAAPRGVVRRWTEFSIFVHVTPDRPVAWQTFLPDVWALYGHVDAVLSQAE